MASSERIRSADLALRRGGDGRWRFAERRVEGALRSDRDIAEPRTAAVVGRREG